MQNKSDLVYNTERPKMQIPEYGRNVQKMVDYAVSLGDKEERNKVANAIIKVMGELNPHLRDVEEYKPKLWTHLLIMSDFQLDVDFPYEKPEREKLAAKPESVPYPQSPIKIGHYGKNVEKMIDIACEMEKGEEREALEKHIGSLMKRFHLTFNSTFVEDETILEHLAKLSDGRIQLSDTSFLPNTNEILKSTTTPKAKGTKGKSRSNKVKNRSKNRKRY
ncbi:MAG: DUF4290 domain-containing protein [Crocinitomicaceae bacterium]